MSRSDAPLTEEEWQQAKEDLLFIGTHIRKIYPDGRSERINPKDFYMTLDRDTPLTEEELSALGSERASEGDRCGDITPAEARALLSLRAGTHVVVPRVNSDAVKRLAEFEGRLHFSRGSWISALQDAYPGDPNMYVEAVDAFCRDLRAMLLAAMEEG